ncbi:heterokaryon incompatibility protein-domain-containing protein [Xylariales sp. PMI_506]|nr:heterokaryon incompatibility protein-domain-containing protein [Xylariales sp. PMI_506]
MSRSSRLCADCSAIRLDPAYLSDHPVREKRRVKTVRRNKDCALCRLFALALYEGQRNKDELYDNHDSITFEWSDHVGPRGGFWPLDSYLTRTAICFGVGPITHRACSLLPRRSSLISATRLKGWIDRCVETHGKDCNDDNLHRPQRGRSPAPASIPSVFGGLATLRVIDVDRMCLVELEEFRPYVALSYVWGAASTFRLTKSTLKILLGNDSLKKTSTIPNTVYDAIALCSRIAQKYLWVDAICLIQNDPVDVQRGIEVMDLIYEKAFLTIIAANGDSASSGLPGVVEGTRLSANIVTEVTDTAWLGVHTELEQHLASSTYRTRAWTFQEESLSRRALCFADGKVFFRCQKTTYYEDCVDDVCERNPKNDALAPILRRAGQRTMPIEDYGSILMLYTARVLTDQNDVLKAMAGIIRRFSEMMGCRFLEGLPTALFDNFILFHRRHGHLRRRTGFPSYSWTGWIGPIDCPELVEPGHWLKGSTWIIWHKRRPGRMPSLVWDPEANASFEIDESLDLYRYPDKRRPFWSRKPLPFSVSRTRATDDLDIHGVIPPYPLLQFWSLVVYLDMPEINPFDGEGALYDRRGEICGYATLDGYEENPYFEDHDEPFECIVLSQTEALWIEKFWRGQEAIGNLLGHSHNMESVFSKDKYSTFYNIMIVQRDRDIRARCGLGIIYKDSIHRSVEPGPVWKEVLLS